jgi:hypothetical protein
LSRLLVPLWRLTTPARATQVGVIRSQPRPLTSPAVACAATRLRCAGNPRPPSQAPAVESRDNEVHSEERHDNEPQTAVNAARTGSSPLAQEVTIDHECRGNESPCMPRQIGPRER